MSKMFDQLAEELFQILKGFGKNLTLFDSDGGRVYDPASGRRMFAEPDKMMVSIEEDGSNSSVELFLSNTADMKKVLKFINTLRHLATRFNVLFSVRKYNKELSPKDFAYASLPVSESISKLYGSIKTSYQRFGESRLIVKHIKRVNEEKRGSRSRNIHSLFVENNNGEKFRFPVIHLSGARAYAQHIDHSGSPHNQIGEWIVNNAKESSKLSSINKHIKRNRLSVNEDVATLQASVRQRIHEIRCQFNRLSRQRGYPVESLRLDFNRKLDEDQDTKHEMNRLGILLGIERDHPLAEALMPLVQLTKGEKMAHNNPKFHRVVALENADDLVEALTNEYGYRQGTAWNRNNKHVAFLVPEAFDAAKSFLEFANSKYKVVGPVNEDEPAQPDKFLQYAQKWLTNNHQDMGHVGDDWSPKDKRAVAGKADQLALGLKLLLSGRIQVTPQPAPPARAANPAVALAFKIGQLLDPKAGMQNDMLHVYLSALHEKLGSGESLSPVEKQVATKCAEIVDASSHDVEEDIWNEGTSDFAVGSHVSTPKGPGTVASCEGEWCRVELMHGKHESFATSELEDANPDRDGMKPMREESDIEEWFGGFDPYKFLNEEPPVDNNPDDMDMTSDNDEDQPGAFDATVSFGGQDNVPVKVYYGANVTSVVTDDGQDILDQLDPEVVDSLTNQAGNPSDSQYEPDSVQDTQTDPDMPVDNDDEMEEGFGSRRVNPEKASQHAENNFSLSDFLADYGRDFNWDGSGNFDSHAPEDLEYDSSYIIGDIAHCLSKSAQGYAGDDDSTLDANDFQQGAARIFDQQVKPELEKHGYVFDKSSPTESMEEPGKNPEQEKLEATIAKYQKGKEFAENNPDQLEFEAKYVRGDYYIIEKNTKIRVGVWSSGGQAMSHAQSLNSKKSYGQKVLLDKIGAALDDFEYDLQKMTGQTDESVVVSDELPPAGMVVPGDEQHDFRSDIAPSNMHGGMTGSHPYAVELARLRKLAGVR